MAPFSYAAETYRPLELQNFPGFEFARLSGINSTNLVDFFQASFWVILSAAATFAVLMGVVAGFQYLTSDVVEAKGAAKASLTRIAIGIGILLSAYLILYTINPRLLNLNLNLNRLEVSVPPIQSVPIRPTVPDWRSGLEDERAPTPGGDYATFNPIEFQESCVRAGLNRPGCSAAMDSRQRDFEEACVASGGEAYRGRSGILTYCRCPEVNYCGTI